MARRATSRTPAASGSGRDNKVLWIVVGVVGLIALILIVVALAGGGGGDDDASGGTGRHGIAGHDRRRQPPTPRSTRAPATTRPPKRASSRAARANSPATSTGATEAQCQCAWDEIEATIPFDEFVTLSAEASGDEVPEELMTIMVGCLTES